MADNDNLGGGTPAGGGDPNAGSGGGNPNPNGGANGGAQPDANGGGGNKQEKVYTFKEDRSDWIPKHRLSETSGKLTAAEKRAQELETALEQERKRVQALSGVTPQDPKAKETEELRGAMYEMFPHLKALEGLTAEQLQDVFDAAAAAKTTTQATWERHAEDMLTGLETEVADKLGSDKLTPTQVRSLRRAYREEAQITLAARQRAQQEGDTSYDYRNDFLSRHERGDRALLKEFAKNFLGDWYEPAVRSVTAKQAQRGMRPVPRGERTRSLPAGGAPQVDLTKDADFKKALLSARGGGSE